MQWSDIDFAPSSRRLRQFAGLWLAVFGGLALWQGLVRDRPTVAAVLGVLAVTVGPLGLLRPQALRWVYVGWTVAVFPVGWAVSTAVLAFVYYTVVTPLALLFRLRGRDALDRRTDPAAATYWKPKPPADDVRRYFRQY